MGTGKMKIKVYLIGLFVILIAGCANSGMYVADESRPRAEFIIASGNLRQFVRMEDVRFDNVGEFARSEVDVRNRTSRNLSLEYKVEWKNRNGMTINGINAWQPMLLSPGAKSSIQSVGQDPDAYAIRVTVRETEAAF